MRNIGFTVCPEAALKKELTEQRLVRLDWEPGESVVSLIMIWHAEKWCSPLLAKFMALAEEIMGETSGS